MILGEWRLTLCVKDKAGESGLEERIIWNRLSVLLKAKVDRSEAKLPIGEDKGSGVSIVPLSFPSDKAVLCFAIDTVFSLSSYSGITS
jgi:hypothetical protein